MQAIHLSIFCNLPDLFLSSILPYSFSLALVKTCLYISSASLYLPFKLKVIILNNAKLIHRYTSNFKPIIKDWTLNCNVYLFKICRGQIILSFSNIGIILSQLRLVNLQRSLVVPAGIVNILNLIVLLLCISLYNLTCLVIKWYSE